MEDNFELMMKLKSDVNRQIMREISALAQKLNEAGETEFCGVSEGWEYSFKKIDETRKEDLN